MVQIFIKKNFAIPKKRFLYVKKIGQIIKQVFFKLYQKTYIIGIIIEKIIQNNFYYLLLKFSIV